MSQHYRDRYDQNMYNRYGMHDYRNRKYEQYSGNRLVDDFCNSLDVKYIEHKEYYIRDEVMEPMWVDTKSPISASHSVPNRSEVRCTVEINEESMHNVLSTIKSVQELTEERSWHNQQITRFENKEREFKTFLARNPGIKDQYDELMVLCKLAGLATPPV